MVPETTNVVFNLEEVLGEHLDLGRCTDDSVIDEFLASIHAGGADRISTGGVCVCSELKQTSEPYKIIAIRSFETQYRTNQNHDKTLETNDIKLSRVIPVFPFPCRVSSFLSSMS